MHAEIEDEVPKHKKPSAKNKPWRLECRVSPEYRKGEKIQFLSREWWATGSYETEERATQAMDQRNKNQNHDHSFAWFEFRVVKK